MVGVGMRGKWSARGEEEEEEREGKNCSCNRIVQEPLQLLCTDGGSHEREGKREITECTVAFR